MTSDQRFTIIISGIGLIFTVMSAILALIVRAVIKWTKVEDRLVHLAADVAQLVEDKDKTHKEILDVIREDRKATNERLTYLERTVWPISRRGKPRE